MDKLKNCPFCGEDDIKVHESWDKDFAKGSDYGKEFWYVCCRNSECFIVGPKSWKSTEDAVKKWNERK